MALCQLNWAHPLSDRKFWEYCAMVIWAKQFHYERQAHWLWHLKTADRDNSQFNGIIVKNVLCYSSTQTHSQMKHSQTHNCILFCSAKEFQLRQNAQVVVRSVQLSWSQNVLVTISSLGSQNFIFFASVSRGIYQVSHGICQILQQKTVGPTDHNHAP